MTDDPRPTPPTGPPGGPTPTQPAGPPGGPAPTQPAPVAGRPTPPPGATGPTAPGGTGPTKARRGGVPPAVAVVLGAVAVVAAVLAVVFLLGKNSEADDKKAAQEELESAENDVDDLEGQNSELEERVANLENQLGTSEETGQVLSDILDQGTIAADDLKACADGANAFIGAFADAIPTIISGTIPPELEAQATETDAQCATADSSYQSFIEALGELEAAGN
jgi:hypothetical protein